MTTRTDTPAPRDDRPRLVLRDKPRDAASMEGWRIEVNEDLDGFDDGDETEIVRANGEPVWLRVYAFVIKQGRALNDEMECDMAVVDPLFETIYVSRELDATESDTLRRLMAEECGRGREQETPYDPRRGFIRQCQVCRMRDSGRAFCDRCEAINSPAPTHIALNYTAPVLTDAERAQLGAALRNADRRDVVLTADGPIERGQLVTQTAEGKAGAVVRKHCDCGVALGDCSHDAPDVERSEACRCGRRWFHDASGWRASRPGDLGHQPAPRVPQVGDEVDVRFFYPNRGGEWERCTIKSFEGVAPTTVAHLRKVADPRGDYCVLIESEEWRWPEAKREAFVPVGPADKRTFKRRRPNLGSQIEVDAQYAEEFALGRSSHERGTAWAAAHIVGIDGGVVDAKIDSTGAVVRFGSATDVWRWPFRVHLA